MCVNYLSLYLLYYYGMLSTVLQGNNNRLLLTSSLYLFLEIFVCCMMNIYVSL